MGKSDDLDEARAATFAWRTAESAEALGDEPGDDPLLALLVEQAEEMPSADLREIGEEGFQQAADLAAEVDRAWALPPDSQPDAAAALVRVAVEMGMSLAAMQRHPLASVRLFRLLVRNWIRLPPEARERANTATMWADYSHPEVVDLASEAAETGDRWFNASLAMAMRSQVEANPESAAAMSERLALVVDHGPTLAAQREAVLLLADVADASAVPALRRALRLPYFGIRFRALELLDQRLRGAIEPEDALFLLEEAVIREPPPMHGIRENLRAYTEYPPLLARAVQRTRPAGGAALLARIAGGDCTAPGGDRCGLDDAWARALLAEVYPEFEPQGAQGAQGLGEFTLPRIDARRGRMESDQELSQTAYWQDEPDGDDMVIDEEYADEGDEEG